MCVWVRNVDSTTGACQVLSAVPTLSESLLPDTHCCTLQIVIAIHTLQSKMNARCLAPSAHRNWMMQCCALLDKSVTVLHCADITQSSLLMYYARCGKY
jgi:hypothetical protein